ncbi:LINE-1 reverse transcriptase like, partial [Trifolium medium]|nr:LINE-1 reverse transcriptase like [Trifolium medium]
NHVPVPVPRTETYCEPGNYGRRGQIPFKYLGLSVGANPRKLATWEPMLNVIRGRLGAWGNKYVSLGGRIVLINAVLSDIPIFYLSYLKMPVRVWKEVVKIQRRFLWGGLSKRHGICWVKWDDVCKPKKEGGLGIRDLRVTNLSLLAKWRWKLLASDSEVWKDVILSKYGMASIGIGNLCDYEASRLDSEWWTDICSLDKESRCFADAVEKKVGDGNITRFWTDIWLGNQSLRQRFPRMYGISTQKENTIKNMGRWDGNTWRWELHWRRNFFEWEEPIKLELFVRHVMEPLEQFVFAKIWKCAAPSKVCAFSWQLLLDRNPSKDNLRKRRILQEHQTNCVICGSGVETTLHLFLHCACASKVWYQIMSWLGLIVIVPHNLITSFGMLVGCGKDKRDKECLTLIWNALMWVIWKFRDDCVFNNKDVIIEDLVDQVKLLSWTWFIGKTAKGPCLLYEWRWSPFDCFHR